MGRESGERMKERGKYGGKMRGGGGVEWRGRGGKGPLFGASLEGREASQSLDAKRSLSLEASFFR